MTSRDVRTLPEMGAAPRPRAKLYLSFGALLLAGVFAGARLASWPSRLHYPGELGDIEGMRLVEMLHLRQGIPIYARPSAERFDASIYGPLYYLLGARLIDPALPGFFPLRLLSMLATLGCAAGCGVLAYWLSRGALASALAPLLFLSYGFVTRHGVSARSDLVAALLVFWGFLIAFRFQSSRALLFATPLMLAGFFYKPQFLAAPLAVLLYLLLEKRYRMAGAFAGLLALGGIGLLGLFQFVVFPRQAFVNHFLLYNVTPFSWAQFLYAGAMFLGLVLLIPILLGLEFVRLHRSKLVGCYLGCAILLGLITVGKVGSDAHYWLECVLVVCPLMASLIAERVGEGKGVREVVCLQLVALFFAQLFTPAGPRARDRERDRAIQTYLRQHFPPGTLALSHWAGDLMRAGLDLPISDIDQFKFLVLKGVFSDEALLAQFQARHFGVIVTHFDLQAEQNSDDPQLPKRWLQVLIVNYRLAASLEMPDVERVRREDRFYVWVPRTDAPPTASRSAP